MTTNLQDLHGIWRLARFEELRNGAWVPAIDADAHGCISYWPNGRMHVLIGGGQRPRLRGEWAQVPAQQKALCLDDLVAYAGSYTVEDDRVRHLVDTCWIPNWEGRELVRAVSFPARGVLQLDTVPDPSGRVRATQRVTWERYP
jgi:hypothetical protein